MNDINKNIISLRKEKHLTQADVAEKLGMNLIQYAQIEKNGRISFENVIKLADILNVPPERVIPPKKIDGGITVPPSPKSTELKLTRTEINLIKSFRSLTSQNKKKILDLLIKKL